MYGLVQAARQFFLKYSKILKKIGFIQSIAEPCLFYKKVEDGSTVLMVIHVDDCYVIGRIEVINQVVKDIQAEGLKLKVAHNTKDYLSCEIVFDRMKKCAWLGQPHQAKKLEMNFGDLVKSCQSYKTPGTPNVGIVQPKTDEPRVSISDQGLYRSVVGSLLHLIKHSRPDIANAVRELSKCMDGATPAAFKEMKRVVKFVIDTKDYGLKVFPRPVKQNKWNLTAYTDSDWAGDKDNRHSVSSYSIFLNGTVILWKSKLQRILCIE
jgi:hypothetical protein